MKLIYLSALVLVISACKKDIPECHLSRDYSISGTSQFNGKEWNSESVGVFTENGKFGINIIKCGGFPLANQIYITNLVLNDSLDFNAQTNSYLIPVAFVGHADQSSKECEMILDTLVPGRVSFIQQNTTQYHLKLNCNLKSFDSYGTGLDMTCSELADGQGAVKMELDLVITRR